MENMPVAAAGGGKTAATSDGRDAERVQVKFGTSSVNLIEVVSGLKEGDEVTVYVTNRDQPLEEATRRNLAALGLP